MPLNRTQLKAFFRNVVKVVAGGSPSAKTRGQGLLNALDNIVDAAQLAEDATPLAPGTTITAATVSDSTAAGRALLTAANAKAQRGLLDRLGFAADAYGKGQPALVNVYGADAGSGAIAYLLTQLAKLQGAAFAQAPAAPSAGQVDDTGDTFSFLPNPAYPGFSQYKVAGLPGVSGAVALDATNSYVAGNLLKIRVVGPVPAKGLAVYVAGSGNVPDGAPLLSAEAFTGTAVVTPATPAAPATTPEAPFPTFDATTRTLTYQHALGTSELEINHLGGSYQPYAAVAVDDASHTAGEWKARVKAYVAGNRAASGSADSPAVAAKAVAVNQIPVANAGSDTAITLPTSQVALMGSGTDAEGPVSFAWAQITGPNNATGLPSSAQNVVVGGLAAGLYQFRLTVTDSAGATKTDDVVVTVNAAAATGALVNNHHGKINVVWDGNSLVESAYMTGPQIVTARLKVLLEQRYGAGNVTVTNLGVGGQTTVQMSADAATQVDPLYLAANEVQNVCLFTEGSNDMYVNGANASAADGFAHLQAYGAARRAAGWITMVSTITPRQDNADFEAKRTAVNQRLRAENVADKVLDIGADSRFQDVHNATYYRDDLVHYTDLGYQIDAQLAFAQLQTFLNPVTYAATATGPSLAEVPYQTPTFTPISKVTVLASTANGARVQCNTVNDDFSAIAVTDKAVQAGTPDFVADFLFEMDDISDKCFGVNDTVPASYMDGKYVGYLNAQGTVRLFAAGGSKQLEYSGVAVGDTFRFMVLKTQVLVYHNEQYKFTFARTETANLRGFAALAVTGSKLSLLYRAYTYAAPGAAAPAQTVYNPAGRYHDEAFSVGNTAGLRLSSTGATYHANNPDGENGGITTLVSGATAEIDFYGTGATLRGNSYQDLGAYELYTNTGAGGAFERKYAGTQYSDGYPATTTSLSQGSVSGLALGNYTLRLVAKAYIAFDGFVVA